MRSAHSHKYIMSIMIPCSVICFIAEIYYLSQQHSLVSDRTCTYTVYVLRLKVTLFSIFCLSHLHTHIFIQSSRNQKYSVCVCVVAFKETWYWDGSNVTNMVMSGVKCTGDELALSQCQQHKTVTCQKTAARFAAGVICSESE